MVTRILVLMTILSAAPVWSQNGANDAAVPADQADDAQMATPPSVSGMAFPVRTGTEERSNYLSLGVMAGVGYDSDVYYGEGIAPAADETYSILPTVQIDRTTDRLHESLSYNPGFLFYQHASVLNLLSQNAVGEVDYRISPHSNVTGYDKFMKTSDVLSQPFSLSGGTVSGSPDSLGALAIGPYANQIINNAGGVYSYQFSKGAMVGGGGGVSEVDYPDAGNAAGLYNANTYDGNAFYNLRLSRRNYVGVTGNYFDITEYAAVGGGTTQTSAILPFYTFYPRKNIFLSVSGGPQYHDATFAPLAPVKGWAPSLVASAHAEVERASFSASYQRTVTAGGGLLGVFTTNAGGAEVRLLLTPSWRLGFSSSYMENKALVPSATVAGENGHILRGEGSLTHSLTPRVSAEFGYDYLREDYTGIPVLANAPDTQRIYATIQYQLRRPLGR
jgi:hypothetical protein